MEFPSQIFNCDETGLPLDHTPSSAIVIKDQKHPRALTSGNKKHISVLACNNASGYVIPPLVIFGRKGLNTGLIAEKIIVFCLPPNTTHLTQPLDKGVFGPIKTYWHQECQKYMIKHPCKVVTEYEF